MSDPEQHAGEVVDVVVCLVAFAERVEVVCKRFFSVAELADGDADLHGMLLSASAALPP
jgi:hypothetical protein